MIEPVGGGSEVLRGMQGEAGLRGLAVGEWDDAVPSTRMAAVAAMPRTGSTTRLTGRDDPARSRSESTIVTGCPMDAQRSVLTDTDVLVVGQGIETVRPTLNVPEGTSSLTPGTRS